MESAQHVHERPTLGGFPNLLTNPDFRRFFVIPPVRNSLIDYKYGEKNDQAVPLTGATSFSITLTPT